MTQIIEEREFPSAYSASVPREMPGSSLTGLKEFSHPDAESGLPPLHVELISKDGVGWMGTFSGGYRSPLALHGIFSMPDPDRLLVVSRGAGYIVEPSPSKPVEFVPILPITGRLSSVKEGLLIIAGFTDIQAFDRSGSRLRKAHVSRDGIALLELKAGVLKARVDRQDGQGAEVISLFLGDRPTS